MERQSRAVHPRCGGRDVGRHLLYGGDARQRFLGKRAERVGDGAHQAASAQLGRVFSSDEDRPPAGAPVVVLSDTHWRSAYGADPAILGRTARIGAVTYTVIGVMPPHFNGDISEPIDAWAPFHAGAYELPTGWDTSVVFRSASVIVRLADGWMLK